MVNGNVLQVPPIRVHGHATSQCFACSDPLAYSTGSNSRMLSDNGSPCSIGPALGNSLMAAWRKERRPDRLRVLVTCHVTWLDPAFGDPQQENLCPPGTNIQMGSVLVLDPFVSERLSASVSTRADVLNSNCFSPYLPHPRSSGCDA